MREPLSSINPFLAKLPLQGTPLYSTNYKAEVHDHEKIHTNKRYPRSNSRRTPEQAGRLYLIFIFYTKLPCPASFMLTSILPPIVQMKTQARRTDESSGGHSRVLHLYSGQQSQGLPRAWHFSCPYTDTVHITPGTWSWEESLQSLAVHLSQTAKTWTITRRLPALGLGTWQSRL